MYLITNSFHALLGHNTPRLSIFNKNICKCVREAYSLYYTIYYYYTIITMYLILKLLIINQLININMITYTINYKLMYLSDCNNIQYKEATKLVFLNDKVKFLTTNNY